MTLVKRKLGNSTSKQLSFTSPVVSKASGGLPYKTDGGALREF